MMTGETHHFTRPRSMPGAFATILCALLCCTGCADGDGGPTHPGTSGEGDGGSGGGNESEDDGVGGDDGSGDDGSSGSDGNGSDGSGDSGSDDGGEPPELEPCPAGSSVNALTPDAGFARVGSVFSSTQYEPYVEGTHNPEAIVIEVTKDGAPVQGCEVGWTPSADGGWAFPSSQFTDTQGRVRAWWTAGASPAPTLEARIVLEGGGESTALITGVAAPHATRANSIHINFDVGGTYDAFRVDVTPLTFPSNTYYSAINFPGGYCGIQNRGPDVDPSLEDKWVLFSVWDTDAVDAELVSAGPSTTCEGFGGEGTGSKCYLTYDWAVGGTYRFELTYAHAVAGRTDYSLSFTDSGQGGGPIEVATLRYGQQVTPDYASGFVEHWYGDAPSCLEATGRAARFSAEKRVDGQWQSIRSATFSAVYNDWHNEICKNYAYGSEDGEFLWSTGGSDRVGPPLMDGDPAPAVDLP